MANMLDDPMILRQIIMDHYQYPHNHQLTEESGYHQVHMASESCIDDITVQSKINPNGSIEDVRFDGVACTISTSSTSIMTELLKGKSIAEAKTIIADYFAMIEEQNYDPERLQEAVAFKNVSKQANRIKCATIGWKAMQEMIEEWEKNQ